MNLLEYRDFGKYLGLSTRYLSTYKGRGQIIVVDGMVDLDNEINKRFVDKRINPQPKVSWYQRNKEKVKEKSKEWLRNNPEKAKQSRKKYDEKNRKPRKTPKYLHCPACNKVKKKEDYSIKKILIESVCDECKLLRKQEFRKRRIEREKLRKRTPEERKKQKQKRIESGKAAAYERERKIADPAYRFKQSVRNNVFNAIRKNGYKKSKKTEEILGCTLDYFRQHIESQFSDGMSFENHGEWHIDHIVPLSTAKTEEDVLRLNHYSNLRPLWALDNLRKGSKEI
jgi:hypothetical protein